MTRENPLSVVTRAMGISKPLDALVIANAIDVLRDGEGDTITFVCDNPDFNGQPNSKVVCNGAWTGWVDRGFTGTTAFEALASAVTAYSTGVAGETTEDELLNPGRKGSLEAQHRAATRKIASFATAYPAPWRLWDREVVDRDGCNVQEFDDTPEDREFWRGVVEAVNAVTGAERRFPNPYSTDAGLHGGLGRDDFSDPINLQGSGPAPIEPREG